MRTSIRNFTRSRKLLPGIITVLAFGAIGSYLLVTGQAATADYAATEAEAGTLAGGASLASDASASGGQGVKFGTSGGSSQNCTNPSHTIPMDPSDAQSGVSIGNYYVTNDTWNASGYSVAQTMYICDYNNWYAVANMNNNSGDGAVKTYPNVHQDFIDWDTNAMPKISSYNTIQSTYAETGPHVGIYEYAYDIWLNGVADAASTEVMIWNDNYGQTPGGSKVATFTDSGRTYDVYRSGTNGNWQYIAFVDRSNVTSGTVNLLDFFNYLMTTKSYIPATSTLAQICYGPELVSTAGSPATFAVNNFSLTAN